MSLRSGGKVGFPPGPSFSEPRCSITTLEKPSRTYVNSDVQIFEKLTWNCGMSEQKSLLAKLKVVFSTFTATQFLYPLHFGFYRLLKKVKRQEPSRLTQTVPSQGCCSVLACTWVHNGSSYISQATVVCSKQVRNDDKRTYKCMRTVSKRFSVQKKIISTVTSEDMIIWLSACKLCTSEDLSSLMHIIF